MRRTEGCETPLQGDIGADAAKGIPMFYRPIMSNENVRLVRQLPELGLQPGAIGIIRSAWFYPTTAYEVEFPGHGPGNRLLLLEGEVVPVDLAMPEMGDRFTVGFAG